MSCGPVREGMKTIRQIADEIGVSKTAVNKQIANLGLRSGLRKNGNQFAIDEHQEALIKQAFSEKSQTEIENQSQTKTQTENHEVGDLVCVLQATIDTLQGQLEVKDRQIAKLTEALVAAQQTAAAAQALHAGTMKQETLEWLDWYNSLPEEQQLAISAVPPDLLEESGLVKTEDAEVSAQEDELCGYPLAPEEVE